MRAKMLLFLWISGCSESSYHYSMTHDDLANLGANREWIQERERMRDPRPDERVAVFADAGVWHEGATSVVSALESAGDFCRVLDREHLTPAMLQRYEVLVVPGGWAPLERAAAGENGLAAIGEYVEGGGRVVGICVKRAYLLSKNGSLGAARILLYRNDAVRWHRGSGRF